MVGEEWRAGGRFGAARFARAEGGGEEAYRGSPRRRLVISLAQCGSDRKVGLSFPPAPEGQRANRRRGADREAIGHQVASEFGRGAGAAAAGVHGGAAPPVAH